MQSTLSNIRSSETSDLFSEALRITKDVVALVANLDASLSLTTCSGGNVGLMLLDGEYIDRYNLLTC